MRREHEPSRLRTRTVEAARRIDRAVANGQPFLRIALTGTIIADATKIAGVSPVGSLVFGALYAAGRASLEIYDKNTKKNQ